MSTRAKRMLHLVTKEKNYPTRKKQKQVSNEIVSSSPSIVTDRNGESVVESPREEFEEELLHSENKIIILDQKILTPANDSCEEKVENKVEKQNGNEAETEIKAPGEHKNSEFDIINRIDQTNSLDDTYLIENIFHCEENLFDDDDIADKIIILDEKILTPANDSCEEKIENEVEKQNGNEAETEIEAPGEHKNPEYDINNLKDQQNSLDDCYLMENISDCEENPFDDDDIADPDYNPSDENVPRLRRYFSEADMFGGSEIPVAEDDAFMEENDAEEHIQQDGENILENKHVNENEKNRTKKIRYRTKESQMENNKTKHPFQEAVPCNCKKECITKVTQENRKTIHETYWNMDRNEQRLWLSSKVNEVPAKRRLQNSRRLFTRNFTLPALKENNTVEEYEVCQKFFVSTLGYKNETFLKTLVKACRDEEGNKMITPRRDIRGCNPPTNKKDKNLIENHIMAFNPKHAHYKRSHAPNRRYLPPDLSIKIMHKDFLEKHSHINLCYETYRKVINDMNIGFYEDTPEKCGTCLEYDMNPKVEENMALKQKHLDVVKASRQNYNADRENNEESTKVFAADMQKVILLPRMPDVKDTFFLSRLICFNETFASMKESGNHTLILWHEGIAARRAEDVSCSFLKLFKENRDSNKIIIWMDNCGGQNKNWVLYSTIITYLNSGECATARIILKYLVKGHTYMSADGIHGRIEQCIRKKKNLFDFQDLKEVCQGAAKRNQVISLEINDIRELESIIRTRKPKNKEDTLPYLKDIVETRFLKNCNNFFYKTSYEQSEYFETKGIIKRKVQVGKFPKKKSQPRGIPARKKNNIIQSLVGKMPLGRKEFWTDLTVNDQSDDLLEEGL